MRCTVGSRLALNFAREGSEDLFAAEPVSVMEIAVKCLFLNSKTFGGRLGILGDSRKHGGVSAIVKPNSFNPQVLVL